jgi:hypothetical protein
MEVIQSAGLVLRDDFSTRVVTDVPPMTGEKNRRISIE